MRTVGRWFADEKSFYHLFTLCCGCIAVLKGFRLPYAWAATQAQMDYRYGLIRRGLFGATCRLFHLNILDFRVFAAVSLALLALFLYLLFHSAAAIHLRGSEWQVCLPLIASSFCVTYLVNLVGYLDIVMAILVLLVLAVRRPWMQLVAAMLAGVIGVLVHELYLIAFLPVSMVALLRWAEATNRRRRLKRMCCLLAVLVVPAVLAVRLALHPSLTPQQTENFRQSVHANGNPAVQDSFFEVLTRPMEQSVADMLAHMCAGRWWIEQGITSLAFFPTALFLIAICRRLVPAQATWTRLFIPVAVFSPLLLSFLGLDYARWMALCTLNAFLAAIACASPMPSLEKFEAAKPRLGIVMQRLAVLLIALNLATNVGLFEGSIQNFPFLEHWLHWRLDRELHRPFLSFDS